MTTRTATIHRETGETQIEITLNLDGRGHAQVSTGVGFLDHMLNALARHARFDLLVRAKGDLHVDEHHTVEDVGIALGRALGEALGDRGGITRMGHAIVPMDEALALVAVDIGGRGYFVFEVIETAKRITGTEIPLEVLPKRQGDPSVLVANSDLVRNELDWHPECSELETIIASAWRWHKKHPDGYKATR